MEGEVLPCEEHPGKEKMVTKRRQILAERGGATNLPWGGEKAGIRRTCKKGNPSLGKKGGGGERTKNFIAKKPFAADRKKKKKKKDTWFEMPPGKKGKTES